MLTDAITDDNLILSLRFRDNTPGNLFLTSKSNPSTFGLVNSLNSLPFDKDEQQCKHKKRPNRSCLVYKLYKKLDLTRNQMYSLQKINYEEIENLSLDEYGNVISGTFNQLILYLTSPIIPNVEFQKQFLVTFPSFSKPVHVLAAMFTRYFSPLKSDDFQSNVTNEKDLKMIQDRIVRIISVWIKHTPYQFDESMIEAINMFNEYLMNDKSKISQSKIIENAIDFSFTNHKNQGYYKGSFKVVVTCKTIPKPILPIDKKTGEVDYSKELTLLNTNPVELARQFTLYQSEMFRDIHPNEILEAIWSEVKGEHIGNNVQNLVKHFDLIARNVSFSIIKEDIISNRAKIFKRWIDVAFAFYQMNNFHGVFSIMYGLTHRSVSRMTKTINRVMKKSNRKRINNYKMMESLSSFDDNFGNYRKIITDAIEPCIPFIGCFQKDLIYVQEHFSNEVDGKINFYKCIKCANLVGLIQKFQNERYSFVSVKNIQTIVRNLPEPPESFELIKLSQTKEPKKK